MIMLMNSSSNDNSLDYSVGKHFEQTRIVIKNGEKWSISTVQLTMGIVWNNPGAFSKHWQTCRTFYAEETMCLIWTMESE